MPTLDAPAVRGAATRGAKVILGAAVVAALAVVVPLHLGDTTQGGWIRTTSPVADTSGDLSPPGAVTASIPGTPASPPPAAPAPPATTTTTSGVRRPTAVAAPSAAGAVEPVAPSSTVAPPVVTVPPAPITTTTPAPVCRNSTNPSCGPFRFDPDPGIDNPMTIQVAPDPTAALAGQEVVFHLTLTDPDGVSYGSSLFTFGDSGIGESRSPTCGKFGPLDPPARNVSASVQTSDVRHTYATAGAYSVTFSFDPGPYSCVDSVTGRGDRPYASPATATVRLVVG
jgi:hypothetical protein